MKRYILDEVATYEEATKVDGSGLAYFIHDDGEIMQTGHRARKYGSYAKLTVLEGSPGQIAEQMIDIGQKVLNATELLGHAERLNEVMRGPR